jgi:ArsR family transcriptional regulator, arsenate/arsenite/antimonite-responsive transcriptional repressor / arsenate reductase (thioredoxin)
MTTTLEHREQAPPSFLKLAGHPLRWRLLTELGRSDRRVHELTTLLDESQNLVSYHLGKLRQARLVSARQSSADRRDAYYTADLVRIRSMLADTGVALHPGLRLTSPPFDREQLATARARVLFLCTGNSARSQMAEALTSARSGRLVEAQSAGSHPKPIHPDAVRVMVDDYGIDLSRRRSKHLSVFADTHFDQVISLCDRVREVCPDFPGRPETVHWSIPDPAAEHEAGDDESYPVFQRTAAELDSRISFLLAGLPNRVEPRQRPSSSKEQP